MSVAIITGCSGLIGSEAAKFFHAKGFDVVGIDNNMREYFFGSDGSVKWNTAALKAELPGFTCNRIVDGQLAASFLTLFILGTLLGIGAGIGFAIVWTYDTYA